MGRESRVNKSRYCKKCDKNHEINAERLVDHSIWTERLNKLGLIDATRELIDPGDLVNLRVR